MTAERRAVVLLSGGLDSATVMAIARAEGREVYALSFRYGQRHAVELDCAARIAAAQGARRHVVLDIDLRAFGGSALTADIDVPHGEDPDRSGIPVTYVPARNTIFLSFALAWAEVLEAPEIWIGVNALDYSGYPDCRPEFIASFQETARLATRVGVETGQGVTLQTPLLSLSKAAIIERGLGLGVDYAMTSSCYDPGPDGRPCMACDSCQLRSRGFAQAGVADPLAGRFGCSAP
jgi:7-cyano-7-deazaguanine synthase